MTTSLLDKAYTYHARLPGIIRATLNDYGIDDLLIDTHLLGWDGKRVTKPLFDTDGHVIDIERYDLVPDGPLDQIRNGLK